MARNAKNTPQRSRRETLFYLMGFMTAAVICLLIGALLMTVGIPERVRRWAHGGYSDRSAEEGAILALPREVFDDLRGADAIIDNAIHDLRGGREHDTFLVQPDKELTYMLRPNVQVEGHILRTLRALNLDPPVLYYPSDANLSQRARDYIEQMSRIHFRYTTDESGFRRTLPESTGKDTVLVAGDSVAFGIGVDDNFTLPSFLQAKLGESRRVLNAGVGGYHGLEVAAMAEHILADRPFPIVTYVMCYNDVDFQSDKWPQQQDDILDRFEALCRKHDARLIILLTQPLFYATYDILLDREEDVRKLIAMRDRLYKECRKRKIELLDSTNIIQAAQKSGHSLFSRFSLYVDMNHFSPLGNNAAADMLYREIERAPLSP